MNPTKKQPESPGPTTDFIANVLNAVADPIFVKDRAHRWVVLNDAFCEFMNRPREELLNRTDHDYFPKREADELYEKDELVFTTRQENINEEQFTDRHGVTHTIVTKKTLYIDNEQQPYLVGVIRTVNEQKRIEAELKALNQTLEFRIAERTRAVEYRAQALARSNAELERFAYIASHDLQEPLRMIAGYVQLLSRRYKGKLDSEADEFIGYVIDGVVRMKALINDLLEYARVGRPPRLWKNVSLDLVLTEVMLNLKLVVEETHAVVTWSVMPEVKGDPKELAQLFQNLIANAIKFRGAEEPRIHIAAQRRGDQWHISVRDNGIGIAPEHCESVFEVFQRLHPTDKYPGTGIGLAICKKIVERHGGRIGVESTPQKGSTFRFTLADDPETGT